MSKDADSVIATQLLPEEHLFWVGQPKRGLRLQASDATVIPFSLMWGGFAIFWETGVILAGAPWIFKLFGIPFVLVGLHLMVGRFWVDAWQRARTYYGVSDRRIIIVKEFFQESVESLYYNAIGQVYLTTCKDGSGTIVFGTPSLGQKEVSPITIDPSPFDEKPKSRWRPAHPAAFALRMIEDVRDVYDMILKLQAATRP